MEYARDVLGMNLSPGMSADKMREKIKNAEIAKGTRPRDHPGGKGYKRKQSATVQPMSALPIEETSVIFIDEGADEAGGAPVDVIVNGHNFQIPRGVAVRVPNYVVGVLEDAIATISAQTVDPETKQPRMVDRNVPSYPFRVVDGPALDDPKADDASAA